MRYILLIAVLLVAVSDLWAQKVKYPQDFTPQSRARLRNDIDIRDYGANGYDTISDETAIESAINAAPDGSVISLSEGTFYANQIDILNKSNLTIQIYGTLKKTASGADSTYLLYLYGCDNIKVSGHLDGNVANNNPVDNCSYQSLIAVDSCTNINITEVHGSNIAGIGVWAQTNNERISITNSSFINPDTSAGRAAIMMNDGQYFNIDDILIRRTGSSLGAGGIGLEPKLAAHNISDGTISNIVYTGSKPTLTLSDLVNEDATIDNILIDNVSGYIDTLAGSGNYGFHVRGGNNIHAKNISVQGQFKSDSSSLQNGVSLVTTKHSSFEFSRVKDFQIGVVLIELDSVSISADIQKTTSHGI